MHAAVVTVRKDHVAAAAVKLELERCMGDSIVHRGAILFLGFDIHRADFMTGFEKELNPEGSHPVLLVDAATFAGLERLADPRNLRGAVLRHDIEPDKDTLRLVLDLEPGRGIGKPVAEATREGKAQQEKHRGIPHSPGKNGACDKPIKDKEQVRKKIKKKRIESDTLF